MTDKDKKLTKTNAKELYCLTDKDLMGIPHNTVSLFGRKYMSANLYDKDVIEAIALKKYGDSDGIDNALRERDMKANKRKQNKLLKEQQMIPIKQNRRTELDNYLKTLGLPGIRSDSALCSMYIEKGNKCGYSMERIGEIMKECDFLYNQTDYSSLVDEEIEEAKDYKGYYDIEECKSSAMFHAVHNYKDAHKNDWADAYPKIPKTFVAKYNIKL
jgi:hypothetical protein